MHLLNSWITSYQQIGQVLQATVASTQHQAGIEELIIVDTKTPIDYVDRRFFPTARNYLNDIDTTIDIFPKYVQKPLQINNETIMERVNILKQFTAMQ